MPMPMPMPILPAHLAHHAAFAALHSGPGVAHALVVAKRALRALGTSSLHEELAWDLLGATASDLALVSFAADETVRRLHHAVGRSHLAMNRALNGAGGHGARRWLRSAGRDR
eukprot:SRR837773.27538.p2 GENE.SRR837773.27538~~SRR837773.27538.p2  ORF type:complete len:113 (-),score=14.92 SRR837773.27538:28-366(-)